MARRRGGPTYQTDPWLSPRPSFRVSRGIPRHPGGVHAVKGRSPRHHRDHARGDRDRVPRRQGPRPRQELHGPGQEGVLRRDDVPPRHPRVHDPGRRSRTRRTPPARAPATARAVPATTSRPSSTTRRTSAGSSPWRAPRTRTARARSSSSCVKDSGFLDRQYTAFGRVVRGMEVADKIVSSPRDRARQSERPRRHEGEGGRAGRLRLAVRGRSGRERDQAPRGRAGRRAPVRRRARRDARAQPRHLEDNTLLRRCALVAARVRTDAAPATGGRPRHRHLQGAAPGAQRRRQEPPRDRDGSLGRRRLRRDPLARWVTGKVFRYQKYRESYHWRDVEIVVDETPIGTFLEIEGPVSTIHEAARALGRGPAGLHRRFVCGVVPGLGRPGRHGVP